MATMAEHLEQVSLLFKKVSQSFEEVAQNFEKEAVAWREYGDNLQKAKDAAKKLP